MSYRTVAYIDIEEQGKSEYFKAKATELQNNYYDPILRLKKTTGYYGTAVASSNNEGDHADTYDVKSSEKVASIQDTLSQYEQFLRDLNACISTAQNLSAQYAISMHKTRSEYYPD